MKTKVKCVDLRTVDGKVVFVLYLYEKEINIEDNQETPVEIPEKKAGKQTNDFRKNGEAMMTDAQKRYLFRILAEKGVEGDKAYQHLKELFQVDTLKEISKMEASKAIELLLAEGKGANNGIPF